MYYELAPASTHDYYVYVKNGLAVEVNSVENFDKLIKTGLRISNDSIDFTR